MEMNVLVLGRRLDERIMIDDDIVITVVEVRGGRIRLGIEAPGHVVHREEVYEDIKRRERDGGAA